MLSVKIICVGKLKEKAYSQLCAEYLKRLSRFAAVEVAELDEYRLGDSPQAAQISAALEYEAAAIQKSIPRGAFTVALCIEGEIISSDNLARRLSDLSLKTQKLCFIVGGSNGLGNALKNEADLRLSFSRMTFPHHLFRVMLLEQIYRAFTISQGGRYHKLFRLVSRIEYKGDEVSEKYRRGYSDRG